MALIATDDGKSFKPCPEGIHPAVCVDVVDLGEMENVFKPGTKQHKCRIVWQVDEVDPENNKRFVVARMYTISLNEKASLRKDLQSWRGRAFTQEELKGFDLEKLIGVSCQVSVVHAVKDGKTYGNVDSVVALGKGMERLVPVEYIRVKDRPADAQQKNDEDDDSEVPF